MKQSSSPRFHIALLMCVFIGIMIIPISALEDTGISLTNSSGYDHYVSFHVQANALAPNYAYDLINKGDVSDSDKWVYNIYWYGVDSDGQTGRIEVWGRNMTLTSVSPLSEPLQAGTDYFVIWRYSDATGGELYINNISQGSPVKGGGLDNSLSSAIHVGEKMYNGGGRQHAPFNGDIWDLLIYEKKITPATDIHYNVVIEKSGPSIKSENEIFQISSSEYAALKEFLKQFS